VHAELTHATVDGQHGLEDAVAAGEALIINADEGHGRVNEDALRVLLVQKNNGTRHSLIVRSQPNRRQEVPVPSCSVVAGVAAFSAKRPQGARSKAGANTVSQAELNTYKKGRYYP